MSSPKRPLPTTSQRPGHLPSHLEQAATNPSRRVVLRAGGALLLAAPLSSCAALGSFIRASVQDPVVRIVGMKVIGASLTHLEMLFDAVVDNPNGFGLKLAGIEYTLDVDGTRVAQGETKEQVVLKANGTTPQKFTVNLPFGDTTAVILRTLQKKEVDYTLNTVFRFGRENIYVRVPVSHQGKAPVPHPPQVVVEDLRFSHVGADGVGLTLVSSVQNPNTFALPLDRFVASVWINDRAILSNQTLTGIEVAPGGRKEVPIDFSVDLAQLGLGLSSLLSRPQLDWRVTVALEAGQLKMPFDKAGSFRLGG